MSKTCKECKYFIGGGDWNLCYSNPPARAKDSWCGFLCYADTESCENFKARISYKDYYGGQHNYCHECGAKMIKEEDYE